MTRRYHDAKVVAAVGQELQWAKFDRVPAHTHRGDHPFLGGVQCSILPPWLRCERRLNLSAEARIPPLEGRA